MEPPSDNDYDYDGGLQRVLCRSDAATNYSPCWEQARKQRASRPVPHSGERTTQKAPVVGVR